MVKLIDNIFLAFIYRTTIWGHSCRRRKEYYNKVFYIYKENGFSEIAKVDTANNNYIKVYKNGMKRVFFLI